MGPNLMSTFMEKVSPFNTYHGSSIMFLLTTKELLDVLHHSLLLGMKRHLIICEKRTHLGTLWLHEANKIEFPYAILYPL